MTPAFFSFCKVTIARGSEVSFHLRIAVLLVRDEKNENPLNGWKKIQLCVLCERLVAN